MEVERLDYAIDLILELTVQACGAGVNRVDSVAISTYAEAIRYLAKHNMVVITADKNKRVVGFLTATSHVAAECPACSAISREPEPKKERQMTTTIRQPLYNPGTGVVTYGVLVMKEVYRRKEAGVYHYVSLEIWEDGNLTSTLPNSNAGELFVVRQWFGFHMPTGIVETCTPDFYDATLAEVNKDGSDWEPMQ